MKINIMNTNKEYIRLAGYVSDNFKEVYLEMHGVAFGHIMLSDIVSSLKNHTVGKSDDVAGYLKFEADSRVLFCNKNAEHSIRLLNSDLGRSEEELCLEVIVKSLKKLLDILEENPWVSVSKVSYWDGDSIQYAKVDTYRYSSDASVSFSCWHIFGRQNYIFDDGTPLPLTGNMFLIEDMAYEHDD